MHHPLTIHTFTGPRLAQQVHHSGFQHTGAYARQHVVATPAFKHHGIDALPMQQLAKQQPSRTATDDQYLGAHEYPVMVDTANFANPRFLSNEILLWPVSATPVARRQCSGIRHLGLVTIKIQQMIIGILLPELISQNVASHYWQPSKNITCWSNDHEQILWRSADAFT